MKLYTDVATFLPLIEESIKKFGYAAEHNADHYLYDGVDHKKTVLAGFPDGSALLAFRDPQSWSVFSEPVAPPERRATTLVEFTIEVLKKDPGVKKVAFELHGPTRREFLKALPPTLRPCRINFTLTWPVFDLAVFDPKLPGGFYKDLRNALNKFYREHSVEVVDAQAVEKRALHIVVDSWKDRRPPRDRVQPKLYHAYIKNDFRGTTSARVLKVDNRIVGINAGWDIPNSSSYYAAIGLHDYSLKDLGDIMYLEDLTFLKKAGYANVDMGGSWRSAIAYKLKFGPAKTYKSFVFSVVRK